jgi:hypothetical protein
MNVRHIPRFQPVLLVLILATLMGCTEKETGDISTYEAENHPGINRAPDLKSFTINDVALSYSLHIEGKENEKSLRLDLVDLRFGQPGEHTPFYVICSSAQFLKQNDYAIPPTPAGPELSLAHCHQEALLDGKSRGVSIRFYGAADFVSAKRGYKLENLYVVVLPAIERSSTLPHIVNDANGDRVKVSPRPSTAKQLRVAFTRPGYDPGGYH